MGGGNKNTTTPTTREGECGPPLSPRPFPQIYLCWLDIPNSKQELLATRDYCQLQILPCISFLTFNSFTLAKLKLKMKTMRKVTLRQENQPP